MNMPIYRAKKIDSDEYVEGYIIELEEMFYISCPQNIDSDTAKESTSVYLDDDGISIHKDYFVAIDPQTLAIHFPDMLDSQGNKIFASLSEDGKGGDKFLFDNEIFIIWFDNQSLKINATNKDNFECNCHDSLNEWYDFNSKCYDLKVIGIKE